MKILIVSQYFWPEEFKINDMAFELVKRGYKVHVLTGNPNYPQGKFYKGYGFKFSIGEYRGLKIYRVPLIPRGNSKLSLILNYISFALIGSFYVLFLKKQYDKILAVNFSPITAVYPGIVYKKLHKKKLFLWVQDLWPESVSSAGKIKSEFILNLLNKMVKHIYKNSDKLLLQSKAFIPSVKEKGVKDTQIEYIPNWAEDLFADKSKINKNKFNGIIPRGFRVMFAGNIGEAQDFESVLRAAEITRGYSDIKWIIVGDGRKKTMVENEIVRLGLLETVYLMGRHSMEDMPSFFVHADIMLLSLKDEEIFSRTIPAKVQTYMASEKPIAGMLNGIGAEVILNADCGYVANAGDYRTLANNIIEAYNQKENILYEKGKNAKVYYDENFSKKSIIDNLEKILQENK